MYQNGVIKKRRGVGSIIAGAFIVLIIISGYEFYLLNNRTQNEYQQVLRTMRNEDMERSMEDLKFTHIVPNTTEDFFELSIRNDGPELVEIEYATIIEEGGSEPAYFELNDTQVTPFDPPSVMPSEVIKVKLGDGVTDITETGVYTIQIITKRGNVFPIRYPQDTEDYPYGYILSGAISKVVGRVVPLYDSFKWGIIPKNSRDVTGMQSSWVLQYNNQDNFVFSVEVSHYGENPLTLSEKTGLYFNPILGASSQHQCYIVRYNETDNKIYPYSGNEVTLPAFNPDTDDTPDPYVLYFASVEEGEDPLKKNFAANTFNKKSRYQVILGIYDNAESYAQGFSLIAIEVSE